MKDTSQWLRISPNLAQCLQNRGKIIKHMGRHTTQVHQLVNNLPHYTGYSDSCGIGTGGVWTYGLNKIGPIMWQEEWPQKVKELFKADTLIINDIDLAGLVLNWMALNA